MIVMAMIRLPDISGSGTEAFSSFSPAVSAVLWFFDILLFVLPLSLLIATLFTVGFLAHDHELTALRAAGWSMFKITWPVILIGVVVEGGMVIAKRHSFGQSQYSIPVGVVVTSHVIRLV